MCGKALRRLVLKKKNQKRTGVAWIRHHLILSGTSRREPGLPGQAWPCCQPSMMLPSHWQLPQGAAELRTHSKVGACRRRGTWCILWRYLSQQPCLFYSSSQSDQVLACPQYSLTGHDACTPSCPSTVQIYHSFHYYGTDSTYHHRNPQRLLLFSTSWATTTARSRYS